MVMMLQTLIDLREKVKVVDLQLLEHTAQFHPRKILKNLHVRVFVLLVAMDLVVAEKNPTVAVVVVAVAAVFAACAAVVIAVAASVIAVVAVAFAAVVVIADYADLIATAFAVFPA